MSQFPSGIPAVHTIHAGPTTLALLYRTFNDVQLLDPPVIAVCVLHLVWLSLLVRYRKSFLKSAFLFGVTCFLIAVAPDVNRFMSGHWVRFGFSENYFDQTQYFIVLLLLIPLSIQVIVFLLLLLVFDVFSDPQNVRPFAQLLVWIGYRLRPATDTIGRLWSKRRSLPRAVRWFRERFVRSK
jgi:hypothetical protein